MKIACSIFISIILIGTGLLYFLHKSQLSYRNCNMDIRIVSCGGIVYQDGYIPNNELSEEARIGKNLFNANCAACHKLNKNSTGPYLRNINERYTTEDIIKFIRKDNSSTIKPKNERGLVCISFPNLTDTDITYILRYTEAY